MAGLNQTILVTEAPRDTATTKQKHNTSVGVVTGVHSKQVVPFTHMV